MARAASRDLERGEVVEGGSTITQQYVRNTDGSGEQSLRRRLAEAGRARAAAAPLGLRPGGPAGDRASRAPWFVGWVLDQLLDPADHRFDALGTSRRARTARVFTGGLRIATTVDLRAQAAAERAVAGVAGRRAGDPYRALVAVEPGTGAVRAMVGGRGWWGDPRFGRVSLATGAGGRGRPARSAFKTFALVAALEQGIPPEAVFAAPDRLVVGRHGRGPAWRVANYEGHGFGHATLRSATELSINTVYAGLLVRLGDADRGAATMVGAAARLGVASRLRAVPSAVLGTNEVTPLEMVTLARGAGGRPRSGCAGSPAPTAGCSTRPGPAAARSWPPGWPRSPATCSGRWSTTAPGSAAGSGGRRPARPAPPRTTPTPGSWASPPP